MTIKLTFPDGSIHEHDDGATGIEVAASIGSRLAKAAVAVKLDGEYLDLTRPLPGSGAFEVVTEGTEDGRHVIRHSAAHVMAPTTDILRIWTGRFLLDMPLLD